MAEKVLGDLLSDQMRKSNSEDIKHHMDKYRNALNPNDPCRSYHQLITILVRSIQRDAHKKGLSQQEKQVERIMKGHLAGRVKLQSEVSKAKAASQAHAAIAKHIKSSPSAAIATTVLRTQSKGWRGREKGATQPEAAAAERTVAPEPESAQTKVVAAAEAKKAVKANEKGREKTKGRGKRCGDKNKKSGDEGGATPKNE